MHRKQGSQLMVFTAVGALIFCVMSARASAQSLDTPMTRLKPLGAPGAVDAYRSEQATASVTTTPVSTTTSPARATTAAYRQPSARIDSASTSRQPASVKPTPNERRYVSQPDLASESLSPARQVVLTQFEAPPLSPDSVPGTSGGAAPSMGPPTTNMTPNNVFPPSSQVITPGDSRGDYSPLAAPQLGGGFANVGNCNCVTAPSSYYAASANSGCAPNAYPASVYPAGGTYQPPATYGAPSAPLAVPAYPAVAPRGFAAGSPTPLVTFGQRLNPIQVGQGILGQPVAYVPGQTFRNFFRYFFP